MSNVPTENLIMLDEEAEINSMSDDLSVVDPVGELDRTSFLRSSVRSISSTRDFSLWYEKSCREFLIQVIQGQTTNNVERLARSKEHLRTFLLERTEQRRAAEFEGRMQFLDLSNDSLEGTFETSRMVNSQTLGGTDGDSSSITSTTSQSSTNSLASQVSDSNLNDVQQSAELFLQDLQRANESLQVIEKGGLLSKFSGIKLFSLKSEAKNLEIALGKAEAMLRNAQLEMNSIGFSDLGLSLNVYGQRYRETVLEFLEVARKEKQSFPKLRKALKLSKMSEGVQDEYPRLTSTMGTITNEIEQVFRRGTTVRDAYLNEAYLVINEVAHMSAKKAGGKFKDQYSGSRLVKRAFIRSNDELLNAINL